MRRENHFYFTLSFDVSHRKPDIWTLEYLRELPPQMRSLSTKADGTASQDGSAAWLRRWFTPHMITVFAIRKVNFEVKANGFQEGQQKLNDQTPKGSGKAGTAHQRQCRLMH